MEISQSVVTVVCCHADLLLFPCCGVCVVGADTGQANHRIDMHTITSSSWLCICICIDSALAVRTTSYTTGLISHIGVRLSHLQPCLLKMSREGRERDSLISPRNSSEVTPISVKGSEKTCPENAAAGTNPEVSPGHARCPLIFSRWWSWARQRLTLLLMLLFSFSGESSVSP